MITCYNFHSCFSNFRLSVQESESSSRIQVLEEELKNANELLSTARRQGTLPLTEGEVLSISPAATATSSLLTSGQYYLFIYLFIYLLIYLFICLFICLFIYLFVYLFIYLFILSIRIDFDPDIHAVCSDNG